MVASAEMNHPTDDVLLRALHEPQGVPVEVREHLEDCASCRARQAEFTANDLMVANLLSTLDDPLPPMSADELLAIRPRTLRRRALLVAEVTLFFAAAAAAMTIPSSPLHKLLFPKATVVVAPVPAPVPETSPAQGTGDAPIGIALDAPASLVVEFRHAQSTGTVEVRLTNGGQVTVRSRGGAVGFTVNEGRVLVDNRVPADEYVVEVPSTLRRARIMVGARVLFSKDGDQAGPVASVDGVHFRMTFADTTRSEP
jgi:hypothetical protein